MMGRRVAVFVTLALVAAAAPTDASVPPGTEAVVETSKGSFTIRLLPEIAPKHAAPRVPTRAACSFSS